MRFDFINDPLSSKEAAILFTQVSRTDLSQEVANAAKEEVRSMKPHCTIQPAAQEALIHDTCGLFAQEYFIYRTGANDASPVNMDTATDEAIHWLKFSGIGESARTEILRRCCTIVDNRIVQEIGRVNN